MLRIVRDDNGLELELGDDQVITVEKPCSLFNDSDKFITDISYQLLAPYTRRNHLFFNHGLQVETPKQDYNFPVTCSEETVLLNKGNINSSVRANGYQFNLEPNYTALNSLTNGIRLPEIKTQDLITFANSGALAARMLDTVQNPDKYPYIFFPVYNTGQSDPSNGSGVHFVNYFNPATHTFVPAATSGLITYGQSPFFKLSYILTQLCNYLGFTATGSFFSDPAFKNICIYTRHCSSALTIYPCMKYMPNITVPKFLKLLRDRYHIASDFDLGTGIATFETLSTISASPECVDITKYLTNVIEQEMPPGKGYTVTLKSDEQDDAFKVPSGDEDTYPPLYQLTVGDATDSIELEVSTLKAVAPVDAVVAGAKYCIANQSTINKYCWPGRLIGTRLWAGLPPDLAPTDTSDGTTVNNWPLRLMNYTGYLSVTGGSFPCSEPCELDSNDVGYWRFMNDSKRLIIEASFPVSVLAGLKNTIKYCFRTSGYNYCEIKTENIMYDKKVNGDTIVSTKIYARTLKFDINTKVQIQPIGPALPVSPYTFGQIKAFYDNSITGFDGLKAEVWATGTAVGHNFYLVPSIVSPTNKGGAGGQASSIVLDTSTGSWDVLLVNQAEIRIYQGNPRYMERFGARTNFTFTGTYWRVPIDLIADNLYEFSEPYWIVF